MTVEDLSEINSLYAQWVNRKRLRLTKAEIYYIKHRLTTLGLYVDENAPPKEAA